MKKPCIWIAVILMMYSCNSLKKAMEQAEKHPDAFSKYCSDHYAPIDSIITRDSIHFDTVYQEGEPIVTTELRTDTVFRTVTIPGSTRFIYKTIIRDSIHYVRNYANETYYLSIADKSLSAAKDITADRDKQKKQKVLYMKIGGGLALSWILYFVIGYFTRRLKTANKIINAVK